MRFLRSLLSLTLLAWAGVVFALGLELSPLERAWVQTHPQLRLGVSREYPPYYFVPAAPARPHGFVIGMVDLWAERLGMSVDIRRFDNNDEAVRALLAGEIDMIPYALPQAGNALLNLPVFAADQVLVARRDLPDISPNDSFGRYRVAAVEGSPAAALLATRFPAAKVALFANADEALRAVASGNADLFVGYQQVVVYHVEKLFLANLVIRRNLGPGSVPIGPMVRRDATALRGVLARAIDSVTAADRSALVARWLPASALAAPSGEAAALTPAEREWVGRYGRIRVGFDADFSPITRAGDLAEPQGLGIDYLRLVTRKTGLAIQSEVGGAFADVYAKGLAGEIDVIVGLVRTPQRRLDYEFVGPFSRVPTAIVMRDDDTSLLTETREFGVRKVALLRQHFLIPELMARHPGIRLVEFDRQDQALAAVAEGAADVALGNLKVVNELIERRFGGMLRITGTVAGGDSELYFGVRPGQGELKQILRKGLDAVSDAESSAIAQRWLVVEVQPGVAWRKLIAWGGPLLLALLVGMGLLWHSRRKMAEAREIEARGRRLAEDAAASRGRFLSYLSHELRGTLGAVASGAAMAKSHPDPAFQATLLDAMAESLRGLSQVFETTLAFEQTLAKPIELQPEAQSLSSLWTRLVAPGQLAAHQKGIAFDARCEAGDETVLVDGPRLQQVVSNLLHNAVKFTSQGQVSIRGCWVDDGEPATPREFEITVADNGPGMSAEEIERVFEPYAQGAEGQRLRHGAGLGLAISRQIVMAMHGSLTAHSTPGLGATFVVRVPLELRR
ncbi:MAG TPA: transporter substrate-binding domain-containing protein [Rhizobacter sp.]|nr:transporter substrate-binding domain-containing protein [Rhizobacter sp.]